MSAFADMDRPAALAPTVALNVTLSGGRRRAAARVEVHPRASGRVGWVRLSGWVGREAVEGIDQMLSDLEGLGCRRLLLDWSEVQHLDYRWVPRLMAGLDRFASRAGGYLLCGLSRYLRDLMRVGGCEPGSWPSAAELLESDPGAEGLRIGERPS